jgi:lipopolysaccharide transport system ATP-binding protein
MSTVISVENLGKKYRLGVINRKMLYEEVQSWWARVRGLEDPNSKVVQKKRAPRARHGDFWALQDVNFEVNQGDVVGIIGKNGSGKSTLLKILAEITSPSSGRALIKGTISSLLEVGTGFHHELTGRENVYLNGSILGMSREEIDRKYDEIVAFSGVDEFMETPVKRYSSGMKLRLAFAVAAHLEPDILILDEVLAVGDVNFQQKCLGKIGEVARGGRTILFVSHNLAAVQSLCNRALVLEEGRVAFSGTSEDAVAYYLHTANPVNSCLRDRTDRRGSGKVKVVAIEWRDGAGRSLTTVRSGDDVDLCLFLENYSGQPVSPLRINIRVKNQFDVPVFLHWTQRNQNLGELKEKGVVVCRLHQLPLCESAYRIDYRIRSAGVELDSLENALEFHIEGSDYFGPMELTQHGRATCAVRGEWSLVREMHASVPAR